MNSAAVELHAVRPEPDPDPGVLRAGPRRPVSDLLSAIGGPNRVVSGDRGVLIDRVTCDSRNVRRGSLFVALQGLKESGLDYLDDARARGASVVALDESLAAEARVARLAIPVIGCRSAREFLADAAVELAGHPSERMTVVCVTGTSGKTTTSYLLESIWRAAGYSTGMIGTIEYRFATERRPAPLTTPDAVELQNLLAEMAEAGVTHVVMETSSHALALDRVRGVACDAAVYTNFARDHLDFHADAEHYFAAKAKLFREVLPRSRKRAFVVLNANDPKVMSLAAEVRFPVTTFDAAPGGACDTAGGGGRNAAGAGTGGVPGDVRFGRVESDLSGSRGTIMLGQTALAFSSRLVGAPHLDNLLTASAVAWRLGVAPEAIGVGIAACEVVPGRLEMVKAGQPFAVIIDYAHKPDALERTLKSLRSLKQGRLIVVFGCGGDRDPGKRSIMGAIAAREADLVVLTSDNPRTEDPMAIIDAIEDGVRGMACTRVACEALGQSGWRKEYAVVSERRAAVSAAIEAAQADDLVLVAGKGHEDYQIVGRAKRHLDDREEARHALARRYARAGTPLAPDER